MLLGEPQRTNADLHFSLLGVPVRVTPWFWLATFLFGWNATQDDPRRIVIWLVAVFVSILLHEFGHAFAFRRYRIDARVILYHFGGLAVPGTTSSWGQSRRLDSAGSIFVSFAGPAIQLLLAAGLLAGIYLAGYKAPPLGIGWIDDLPPFSAGAAIAMPALYHLADFLLYVNFYWAVMNLLPVYPLDGGQIAREMFLIANPRTGIARSLILSIVTCVGVAIWGMARDDRYLGIMFIVLAISSFMALQAYRGRGGYGGSDWQERDW